jgi:hypothetical protein
MPFKANADRQLHIPRQRRRVTLIGLGEVAICMCRRSRGDAREHEAAHGSIDHRHSAFGPGTRPAVG